MARASGPGDAPDRGHQIVVNERLGHPFVDAHPHRFEQVRRVDRAGENHQARVRKLPPDGGNLPRQRATPDIDDDGVGALARRLSTCREIDRRRMHLALAERRDTI